MSSLYRAKPRFKNQPYMMPRPAAKRQRVTTTTTSIPYPPSRRAAAQPMAVVVSDSNSMGLNRRGVASRETGFVDLASAGYGLSTTGTITLIATVAQGASVSQRVGKKILWKSLQFRGFINAGDTGTIADYAIIIVYDKRPTGVMPAITDVLNTANSLSFNNDANSGRFRILKRIDGVMIGNNLTPDTGCEMVDVSYYLKLRGLPCVYKAAATGAIGDIEEGALYQITVGNIAAGTANPALTGGFRTRFIDI